MTPSNTLLQSFAPVIPTHTTTLVLGSMPGQKSLDEQEYYAHPQNLFWKIPSAVLGIDLPSRYSARLAILEDFRVGLWDVLQYCERQGSLDANIRKDTEQANDLVSLLSHNPSITKICFNGQKAYQAFKRHVQKPHADFFKGYTLVVLPSTSPANAGIPKAEKYRIWQQEVWQRA